MKAELLFMAAFDRVSATQATVEYLWDKSVAFADEFPGDESDPRFPIYTRLFCLGFRPGWNVEPIKLIEQADTLSVNALACLAKCKGETPERLKSNAEAEAEAEAIRQGAIAEREATKAKREAEAKAKADADKKADELLKPATLEAVLITELGIHGLAENAYKKAGLETVGDVLTYKAAKPLEEISGISAKFEKQTLEAIEAIRPNFAKAPTTDDAPAE